MANTIKVLGEGQLASSKGTLYTVPGATTSLVKKITCFNSSASTTETVTIYAKPGATSRVIGYGVLAPKETLVIEDVMLETGDLIEGFSTNASTTDYTVLGLEVA